MKKVVFALVMTMSLISSVGMAKQTSYSGRNITKTEFTPREQAPKIALHSTPPCERLSGSSILTASNQKPVSADGGRNGQGIKEN